LTHTNTLTVSEYNQVWTDWRNHMKIHKVTKLVATAILLITVVQVHMGRRIVVKDQSDDDNKVRLVKQHYERLRKADFASLAIKRLPRESNQNEEEQSKPFKRDGTFLFELDLTNISDETTHVYLGDQPRQIRPVLTRDGDQVPYTKSRDQLLIAR